MNRAAIRFGNFLVALQCWTDVVAASCINPSSNDQYLFQLKYSIYSGTRVSIRILNCGRLAPSVCYLNGWRVELCSVVIGSAIASVGTVG